MDEALLLARTVRHLRPAQVAHRLRLRAQKAAVQAAPDLIARVLSRPGRDVHGWPSAFRPVDRRTADLWPPVETLAAGRIRLLGGERELQDFRSTEPPQLWRYHLHYWDWAWSLALHADRAAARATFAKLYTQWRQQTQFGQWDEWSPYVVALRAWSWCGQYDALVRGSDLEPEFVDLLALHAGYLRTHLEQDVGGNHLVKDVKALVGLAVFFGDTTLLRNSLGRLEREVRRQVLPDGGHYERAPAYHCQVLADLVDVRGLLGSASPSWLDQAVERMQCWLGLVLLPDGTVPLLNDGFPVPQALLDVLQPGPSAPEGLTLLPDSGLGVLKRGAWHLLADVGDPCPAELPAHAHADTLGFLLYEGRDQVVGEAFTSTYQPGPRRAFERGTAAHSTVQVDTVDSTEVWGAFRAARRAAVRAHEARDNEGRSVLSASHDGYRRLPGKPVHRRTWILTDAGLKVDDEVVGEGRHTVQVHLHLMGPRRQKVMGLAFTQDQGQVAAGWERLTASPFMLYEKKVSLPWRGSFEIVTRGNL